MFDTEVGKLILDMLPKSESEEIKVERKNYTFQNGCFLNNGRLGVY